MRYLRSIAALSILALLAVPAAAQVTPEALAKLEARKNAHPDDVGALRSVGIAYFKMKRYGDAETVLAQAAARSPKDALVALYLGMSAEERGDLTAARTAYTRYLSTGKTKTARNVVNQRLAAVAQKELKASAAATVAQEQQLRGKPTDKNTIAILPLTVSGPDTYQPLGRGLADMMISDFGKVPALKLLERDRIQSIYDEIKLGQSGQVDANSAARSGHLLQAGRIVTGSMTVQSTTSVTLATSVVNTQSSVSIAGGNQGGALDNLFQFEKDLVVQTLTKMGIALTDAEKRAITGNIPTRNVQAFIAYSRGLASSDAGRLDEAANFFDNARQLDPGFSAAGQHAEQARAGQAGATVTTTQIEGTLRGSAEGQVVAAAERGAVGGSVTGELGSTLSNAIADVNPSSADAIGHATAATQASTRDATSTTTTTDVAAPGKTGTLTIVIKRP